jgi:hypothetical protein
MIVTVQYNGAYDDSKETLIRALDFVGTLNSTYNQSTHVRTIEFTVADSTAATALISQLTGTGIGFSKLASA